MSYEYDTGRFLPWALQYEIEASLNTQATHLFVGHFYWI